MSFDKSQSACEDSWTVRTKWSGPSEGDRWNREPILRETAARNLTAPEIEALRRPERATVGNLRGSSSIAQLRMGALGFATCDERGVWSTTSQGAEVLALRETSETPMFYYGIAHVNDDVLTSQPRAFASREEAEEKNEGLFVRGPYPTAEEADVEQRREEAEMLGDA